MQCCHFKAAFEVREKRMKKAESRRAFKNARERRPSQIARVETDRVREKPKMSLIKVCLLCVIIFQYIQCSESRRGGKRSNVLSPLVRNNKDLTRNGRNRNALTCCLGNRKSCGSSHLRQSKPCKRQLRKCRKKRKQQCYKNQTCAKRLAKMCKRKYRKCLIKNVCPPISQPVTPNTNNTPPTRAVKPSTSPAPPKKRLKEQCFHPDDCEPDLCCARQNRIMICKQIPTQGNICTKSFSKRSPEMFQRCPCGPGLYCAPPSSTLTRHNTCQMVT